MLYAQLIIQNQRFGGIFNWSYTTKNLQEDGDTFLIYACIYIVALMQVIHYCFNFDS